MLIATAPLVPTVRTLDGDVYSGTAGIALFLVEYLAHVGDIDGTEATVRRALAPAIEHAIEGRHSLAQWGGLYVGIGGVGHVALRVGEVLCDHALTARGLELLAAGVERCIASASLDVIGGLGIGGLVLGLASWLPREPRVAPILDHAYRGLAAHATVDAGRCTWPVGHALSATQRHFMTGFSHGGAGLAAAMFAVGRNNPAARELGLATMRTEHSWFMPETKNWPDLRTFAGETLPVTKSDRRSLTSGTTWCHGAPGILLTLAIEAQLTGERSAHFEPALATTIATIKRWTPGDDVTLCHGVLGLVETVLLASPAIAEPKRASTGDLKFDPHSGNTASRSPV